MIFHIPHASVDIPLKLREHILLSPVRLDQEILTMTDHYTDELFTSCADAEDTVIIYGFSRLVIDPERFPDDAMELMSAVGLGAIYTKTCDGLDLRAHPTEEERKKLLDKYYYPHHQKLEKAVAGELSLGKPCLIVDCHSFPSSALPYEFDQSDQRPDFCLGVDEYHTPGSLTDLLEKELQVMDYTVRINSPYCGCVIPAKFFKKDKRVLSLMIEVNRRLYMDEGTGSKNAGYDRIQEAIGHLITVLRSNI